jgi:hypothetical protein
LAECVPANVLILPRGTILKKGTDPPLATQEASSITFWMFLWSFGGEWIWDYLKEGEGDMPWIWDALEMGMLIGVTDGSYAM